MPRFNGLASRPFFLRPWWSVCRGGGRLFSCVVAAGVVFFFRFDAAATFGSRPPPPELEFPALSAADGFPALPVVVRQRWVRRLESFGVACKRDGSSWTTP